MLSFYRVNVLFNLRETSVSFVICLSCLRYSGSAGLAIACDEQWQMLVSYAMQVPNEENTWKVLEKRLVYKGGNRPHLHFCIVNPNSSSSPRGIHNMQLWHIVPFALLAQGKPQAPAQNSSAAAPSAPPDAPPVPPAPPATSSPSSSPAPVPKGPICECGYTYCSSVLKAMSTSINCKTLRETKKKS